jgi:hypothetical protein
VTGLVARVRSDAFILVPGIEYNFSAGFGISTGVRWVAAGRNTGSTIAPVIAFNYVL